jgi:hypothetical protein
MKRKVFSIILTLVLTLSMSVTSFAASIDSSTDSSTDAYKSFAINEYDVITELRSKSDQDLGKNGYSKDQIKEIRSDSYEKDLLKRAQLSDSELKSKFNYSAKQIELLRSYKGTPIQDTPEMAALAATCTGTVSAPAYSTSSITIKLSWTWSTAPSFMISDIAAVRWQGTDTAGSPLNVALNNNTTYSYCKVNYVYLADGTSASSVKNALSVTDAYGKASCIFAMTKIYNGQIDRWAKSGELQIKVDKTGTNSIKEVAVCFAYGHQTISGTPSVSWPSGFSITFSSGVSKMFTVTKRVSNTGVITSY